MFTIKLFLSIIPIVIIALAMYNIDIEKEPKNIIEEIRGVFSNVFKLFEKVKIDYMNVTEGAKNEYRRI